MSAQIITLAAPQDLDAAWDAYKRLADEVLDDPKLLVERAHAEARIRAFRRFEKLFIIGDRA